MQLAEEIGTLRSRVERLEAAKPESTNQGAYIEHLERLVTNVKFAVIDCFGKNPIAYDGVLQVRVRDYDNLVAYLNAKLEPPTDD